jgi:hypothetical protein
LRDNNSVEFGDPSVGQPGGARPDRERGCQVGPADERWQRHWTLTAAQVMGGESARRARLERTYSEVCSDQSARSL